MANTNTASSSSGIGIGGLLGVAFIILKLTHVIDWSWWWVLAPFWISFALVIVVMLVSALLIWIFNR